MSASTARRSSRVIVGLTVALTLGNLVLATTMSRPPAFALLGACIVIVLATAYAVLGSLIVSRQPGNKIGWGFLGVGAVVGFSAFGVPLSAILLRSAHDSTAGLVAAWITNWSAYTAVLAIPWLFLLFPDGHLPTPRWRAVGFTLGIASLVAMAALALQPDPTLNNLREYRLYVANPLALPYTWLAVVQGLAAVTILGCALLSVIALRQRARDATSEVRQQVRWLKAVATTAGVMLLVGLLLSVLPFGKEEHGGPPVFPIVLILFVTLLAIGIPIASGVAILRYRLWALDVVVKKTVVAIALTVLMLIPGGLVLWIGSRLVINGTSDRTIILVGGITLGLLTLPLLRVSRRIAARIAYGRRATPYEVLAQFAGHLGETYSDDSVLPRMARVLADGTGAASVRVLLHVGAALQEAAAVGEAAGPETLVTVIDRGQELGALALTMPPSDPMNPAKEQLAADLAAQAGPVLRNVQLVEELRASRQRLVAAQDAERRKLERNLHDGAQQQLVALSVQLRLAEQLAGKDPDKQREVLSRLGSLANDALDDLRDLARGIYPPLLADKGLGPALESQARKAAVPTMVETDGLGRYEQDVEAAVYFCSLEGLNNVAKYAEATQARIALVATDGILIFRVTDDGKGFNVADRAGGTGLQGMRDRLDAIGGALAVTSAPGAGTTVEGRIPAEPVGSAP